MQGSNHIRSRPDGSGRFSGALNIERNAAENKGFHLGKNFLGIEWAKLKGIEPDRYGDYLVFPSFNEVFQGIKMEAKYQLK
jgi:hypothetical protein